MNLRTANIPDTAHFGLNQLTYGLGLDMPATTRLFQEVETRTATYYDNLVRYLIDNVEPQQYVTISAGSRNRASRRKPSPRFDDIVEWNIAGVGWAQVLRSSKGFPPAVRVNGPAGLITVRSDARLDTDNPEMRHLVKQTADELIALAESAPYALPLRKESTWTQAFEDYVFPVKEAAQEITELMTDKSRKIGSHEDQAIRNHLVAVLRWVTPMNTDLFAAATAEYKRRSDAGETYQTIFFELSKKLATATDELENPIDEHGDLVPFPAVVPSADARDIARRELALWSECAVRLEAALPELDFQPPEQHQPQWFAKSLLHLYLADPQHPVELLQQATDHLVDYSGWTHHQPVLGMRAAARRFGHATSRITERFAGKYERAIRNVAHLEYLDMHATPSNHIKWLHEMVTDSVAHNELDEAAVAARAIFRGTSQLLTSIDHDVIALKLKDHHALRNAIYDSAWVLSSADPEYVNRYVGRLETIGEDFTSPVRDDIVSLLQNFVADADDLALARSL